jgi:hypothetical protein
VAQSELNGRRAADSRRTFAERIAAGDTRSGIKGKLVAPVGAADPGGTRRPRLRPARLGACPWSGWSVAAGIHGASWPWRWTRAREPSTPAPRKQWSMKRAPGFDPDEERRLDEELARFDAWS